MSSEKNTLIVSAHPDDIELGMGATLGKLDNVTVFIASDSQTINKNHVMYEEAKKSLCNIYNTNLIVGKWETMYLWKNFQEIRNKLFELKQELRPDVVYCTSYNSIHPDHKAIGEACNSIFIETTVYSFEPIRSNQNFRPNKWVKITKDELNRKLRAVSCYSSQDGKLYFDPESIIAQARFYGSQINEEYAEAFEVVRQIS